MFVSKACGFRTTLNIDEMHARLNETGPWLWKGGESDTDGVLLWTFPLKQGWTKLRIIGDPPAWILEISFDSRSPLYGLTREELDKIIFERLLPAINATDLLDASDEV